jgi:hypothetical protein
MKAKEAAPSALVPRFIGRAESDMVARGMGEQLDLFREILTPQAKLQVLAMLALSDPKQLDQPQRARVADIAKTMGYEPTGEKDHLSGSVFEDIIKTGWKLKTKYFDIPIREPLGLTKDGRRKYKVGISTISILQEFQRYYEDEEGRPINLDEIPKDDIKVIDKNTPPIYMIPLLDEKGNARKNRDGTIRYRRASGLEWRFLSRFAELARNKETAWVFYTEAIGILRRFLSQPTALNLMLLTLFWKGDQLIEMSHEKLVAHLDIRGKDADQVNRAIDAAFKVAFNEGIIDREVKIREAGYYKKTQKTGKERRKGKVYQWRRAAKWRGGKALPMVPIDGKLEAYNEDKDEKPKS